MLGGRFMAGVQKSFQEGREKLNFGGAGGSVSKGDKNKQQALW